MNIGNSWVVVTGFFLVWFLLWLPFALVLQWKPLKPLTGKEKLPLLAGLYLLAPLLVWLGATIKGLSWGDLGLETAPSFFISLTVGFGLGVAGLGAIFGIEYFLGWLQWFGENRHRLFSVSLPILALALWISVTEELVFRGFLLHTLREEYNIVMAGVFSSLIFALLHLVWEQKKSLPQLPGLWLMGMVLVGARLVDGGSLGLATGLHGGWVWGLTCLAEAQLMSYTGKGYQWITGLGEEPLAGLAGIVCLLGTGVVLMFIK